MLDIRLITILPSQPVPGVQQQPNISGGGQNIITIGGLQPGTTLSGFIVNRDSQGNPILRTQSGDVVFSSQIFLKIGTEVEIRVQNAAGNNIARILSINGQAPELAAASTSSSEPDVILPSSQRPSASAAQAQQAASPAVQQSVQTPTFTATLLTPVPSAEGQPPATQAGAQISFKILSLQVAIAPPTGDASQPSQNNVNPALYSAYTRQQASAAPSAAASATNTSALPSQAATSQPPATSPATQTTFSQATPQNASTQNTPLPSGVQPAAPAAQPTPGNEVKAAGALAAIQNSIASAAPNTPLPAIAGAASNAGLPAGQTPAALASVAPAQLPAGITQPTATTAAPFIPPHIAPQAGQVLQGVVIGHEPSGETLLETPVGLLRLPVSAGLTTGSTLRIELTQIATLANATPTTSSAAAPVTELAKQWQSLQSIFSLLAGSQGIETLDLSKFGVPTLMFSPAGQPQNAAQPQQALPFPAGLMVFLTALRGGDFRNWLGRENAQKLEDAGHSSLLEKASGEFSALARQYSAATPGNWQPLFFPVAVDGVLQQVRLFTKREKKQNNSTPQKPEDDTRFVIEMELSQLGEMQMDGFVRRREQDMQFDLVIRSQQSLTPAIQKDIQEIYLSTAELTGFKGSLNFQVTRIFPVSPMEEMAKEHLSNLMA
jgi:hypothetical protein